MRNIIGTTPSFGYSEGAKKPPSVKKGATATVMAFLWDTFVSANIISIYMAKVNINIAKRRNNTDSPLARNHIIL